MYIVIAGCGRYGTLLANRLSYLGHSVVIIDRRENAFQEQILQPKAAWFAPFTVLLRFLYQAFYLRQLSPPIDINTLVFRGFRNFSKTELEIFPNLAAWRKSPSGLTGTNPLNSYHLAKHRLVGTPPATG